MFNDCQLWLRPPPPGEIRAVPVPTWREQQGVGGAGVGSLPVKTGPGQVMGTEDCYQLFTPTTPACQPDGGAWGYRLPEPTPRGCSGLPTSCLGSGPLDQVPAVLGLLPGTPQTLLQHVPNQVLPIWMMDWQLFLGVLLSSQSGLPKTHPLPLASFKKPLLNSCCKEPPHTCLLGFR